MKEEHWNRQFDSGYWCTSYLGRDLLSRPKKGRTVPALKWMNEVETASSRTLRSGAGSEHKNKGREVIAL